MSTTSIKMNGFAMRGLGFNLGLFIIASFIFISMAAVMTS